MVQEVETQTTQGNQVLAAVLAALPAAVVQPLMFKTLARMEANAAVLKAELASLKSELALVKLAHRCKDYKLES